MGYGYYVLPDGREAGYGVEAECDAPGCCKRINRGLGHLCGEAPAGHEDPDMPGCGRYFCEAHRYTHACSKPQCQIWNDDYDGECCVLVAGHDLPHHHPDGWTFERTTGPEGAGE